MNGKLILIFGLCLVLFSSKLFAQQDDKEQSPLIQFSGIVLDGSEDQLYPVPYANIYVKNKNRGTFTDLKGFFSIVIEKTDVVVFSAVGYKSQTFEVPDSLFDDRYSIVQLMVQDTFNLPETVVFPWPSKEHFKLEFLAMDVTEELRERAVENLAQRTLDKAKEAVPSDGNENADFYLRQQASSYYYLGQTPPMNIFNPIAWKKFFDAWKNGDYKRKSKRDKK